ncbi:hypothetical protein T484DRAFT_1817444 [Baffinella frigidus]|nr:hypothetical protein T484DRAFT_1817444 [Cryptophyta sp. CCMP2293]
MSRVSNALLLLLLVAAAAPAAGKCWGKRCHRDRGRDSSRWEQKPEDGASIPWALNYAKQVFGDVVDEGLQGFCEQCPARSISEEMSKERLALEDKLQKAEKKNKKCASEATDLTHTAEKATRKRRACERQHQAGELEYAALAAASMNTEEELQARITNATTQHRDAVAALTGDNTALRVQLKNLHAELAQSYRAREQADDTDAWHREVKDLQAPLEAAREDLGRAMEREAAASRKVALFTNNVLVMKANTALEAANHALGEANRSAGV